MAGRRSPQSPSINRLTSQPETIPSCYRRSRHAEFQPHHGRHLDTFAVLLSEAQSVREALQETHPECKEHLDNLLRFMEQYSYAPANGLFRPGIEIQKDALDGLAWFNTNPAERLAVSAAPKILGADRLFAYARALLLGVGFVTTDGSEHVKFVGYSSKLTVNLSAGTILLDATADIDGISRIVLWQADVEVPQAHYDNLEIIQVPQHTTRRLSEYFKKVTNRRAYADWIEQTIKEHMKPGEKGLVVCKQALFRTRMFPLGRRAIHGSISLTATRNATSGMSRAERSVRSIGAPG